MVPGRVEIVQLAPSDAVLVPALLEMFGQAFHDIDAYRARRPGKAYLERLLARDHFVALAALQDGEVIGGLAAYELEKIEQEQSEFYIYDLAVDQAHRRRGIATALIGELQRIAARRGAWVIFVQADPGDEAAIALYTRLGVREDVLHFDIPVNE